MKCYVGIILVKKDGSVLSQLRDKREDKPDIDSPNAWSTVGGLMEATDKSTLAGAKRELRDETDYACEDSDLKVLIEDWYAKPSGEMVSRVVYWAWYDGKQPINTHEGQEIRFLTRHELDTIPNFDIHDVAILRSASEKSLFGSEIEKKF